MSNTLIIIPSQIRSGDLTFKNFKKYLLDNNNADLALFISDKYTPNEYLNNAKYKFFLEEYNDHRKGLIKELELLSLSIPDCLFDYDKKLNNYQISCIIHVYYKLFILRMLKENKLLEKYDWFIINRSDLLHGKYINVKDLKKSCAYIPNGEFYGGLPDRFSIIPKKYITEWLYIYKPIYFKSIKKLNKGKRKINPEIMVLKNVKKKNIKYSLIDYSFISVRDKNGSTRNSLGKFNTELNLYIKYLSEYKLAIKNECLF